MYDVLHVDGHLLESTRPGIVTLYAGPSDRYTSVEMTTSEFDDLYQHILKADNYERLQPKQIGNLSLVRKKNIFFLQDGKGCQLSMRKTFFKNLLCDGALLRTQRFIPSIKTTHGADRILHMVKQDSALECFSTYDACLKSARAKEKATVESFVISWRPFTHLVRDVYHSFLKFQSLTPSPLDVKPLARVLHRLLPILRWGFPSGLLDACQIAVRVTIELDKYEGLAAVTQLDDEYLNVEVMANLKPCPDQASEGLPTVNPVRFMIDVYRYYLYTQHDTLTEALQMDTEKVAILFRKVFHHYTDFCLPLCYCRQMVDFLHGYYTVNLTGSPAQDMERLLKETCQNWIR